GGLFPETSIGWYRKHFAVARSDSGHRFQVQFDGVFRNGSFWLNGFYLGNNLSGYIGKSFDITDYINYDRENVLVVRVDASQYEGWFYEGAGIYRHVWLNEYDNVHVSSDGLFVYSTVKQTSASVHIEINVQNENFTRQNSIRVASYIKDRNGKVLGISVNAGLSFEPTKSIRINQSITVDHPVLWSTDNPYLYRVVSLIQKNGKTIDSVQSRFGIRTINVSIKGLFVNGKYVKVRG